MTILIMKKRLYQTIIKKLSHNQFTKSLTSFHTKKTFAKNVTQQNSTKKTCPIKQEKSAKTKRVYLSR